MGVLSSVADRLANPPGFVGETGNIEAFSVWSWAVELFASLERVIEDRQKTSVLGETPEVPEANELFADLTDIAYSALFPCAVRATTQAKAA